MSAFQDWINKKLGIKSGGKVTYDDLSESLPAALEALTAALQNGLLTVCADLSELAQLTGADPSLAWVSGSGVYAYSTTDTSGTASIDGTGYWIRQNNTRVQDLLNFDATGLANGHTLVWNAGANKYVSGFATISQLGWANISNKPLMLIRWGQPGDGVTGGHSVGTVATPGDFNIRLSPLMTANVPGSNGILLTTDEASKASNIDNSILVTTNTNLNNSNGYNISNSTVLGQVGNLTAQAQGGVLTGILAVGANGLLTLLRDKDGRIHLGNPAGSTTVANTIWGATRITGAATFDSNVAVAGNLTANTGSVALANTSISGIGTVLTVTGGDVSFAANASVGGNSTVGGTLTVTGAASFTSTGTFGGKILSNDGGLEIKIAGTTVLRVNPADNVTTISGGLTHNGPNFTVGSAFPKFTGLQVYASESAAAAAGLQSKTLYGTATGEVRYKL